MAEQLKEFAFAAKRGGKKTKGDESVIGSFVLEGKTFGVRSVPDARLAHLVAAVNSAEEMTVVARVFDFMERALLPGQAKAFEAELLELDIPEVMEVFQEVLRLVSEGKAGGSSSDSSASPRRAGRSSTATARGGASTR